MQPEAQTTTRGSLAVSADALEIANVIQGALEVFWFTFYLLRITDLYDWGLGCRTKLGWLHAAVWLSLQNKINTYKNTSKITSKVILLWNSLPKTWRVDMDQMGYEWISKLWTPLRETLPRNTTVEKHYIFKNPEKLVLRVSLHRFRDRQQSVHALYNSRWAAGRCVPLRSCCVSLFVGLKYRIVTCWPIASA